MTKLHEGCQKTRLVGQAVTISLRKNAVLNIGISPIQSGDEDFYAHLDALIQKTHSSNVPELRRCKVQFSYMNNLDDLYRNFQRHLIIKQMFPSDENG